MYIWPARPEVEHAVGLHGSDLDRYMVRLNLRLIAGNPFDYLLAVGGAAAGYVLPATTDKASGGTRLGQAAFGMAHVAVLAGFIAQAFGMVGRAPRRPAPARRGDPRSLRYCRHPTSLADGIGPHRAHGDLVDGPSK